MLVALSAQRYPLPFQNFLHTRQARSDHRVVQRFADHARQVQPQLSPRGFPSILALGTLVHGGLLLLPTPIFRSARNAATQISTTFRTSPVFLGSPTSFGNRHSVRGTVKKRKFALAVLGAVLFAVVAISTRAYCAPPDASRTQGRQIHFVPNSQEFWDSSKNWPTNFGPAYRDTVTALSNFLPCTGKFALC